MGILGESANIFIRLWITLNHSDGQFITEQVPQNPICPQLYDEPQWNFCNCSSMIPGRFCVEVASMKYFIMFVESCWAFHFMVFACVFGIIDYYTWGVGWIWYGLVSILKSLLDAWSPMSELLSLRWSNWSEGRWLQLICCALPKRLCP